MTDERAAAFVKLETRASDIEKQCKNLADAIKQYMILIKSTGHALPPPPRPKFPVLERVQDSLQLLHLYIKVMRSR